MEMIEVFLHNGGAGTYLILFSALVFVILGVERLTALFMRLSYNTDNAVNSIRSLILSRNYTEALQICNTKENAPDLNVVKAALLSVESGREAMRSALGGAVLEVTHQCEARLPYLALIANVATLLGLFGTITGLIKTFMAIGNADAADKARLLSLGISEAMHSTAAGLAVGIAAMIVHTICASRADAIVGHAQDVGFKVITWVEQSERTKTNG